MLQVASIIFSIGKEKDKKQKLRKLERKRPEDIIRKTVLIEEPEVFLHPNWQSKLADFFAFCTKQTDIKFIIETHSEYFIRKFQYLIAKKVVNPKGLAIYYFYSPKSIPEGEKRIKTLTIRNDGMMDEDFGDGFFDEATRLTIDLLKIQNYN